MINILIVDDDYNKVQLISSFALSYDDNIKIVHASTSQDARQRIRQTLFDLMLIDVNLPASMGSTPSALGGMELFDVLILDSISRIPLDIEFITEKEDSLQKYISEATQRGISLSRFDASQDTWKKHLIGKIKLAFVRRKRMISESPVVDIAIITALGPPELDAVLNLPYNWETKRFTNDPTGYYFGKKTKGASIINIVCASARRKGMASSSALAMNMVERFEPKIIVMLGICAGVKGKVNLGDVIIADPSWDWGSGKKCQDKKGSELFLAAPYQAPLDSGISQLAMELANDDFVLSSIKSGWTKELPPGKFSIHVGPLASGSMVLASNKALTPITLQNKDLMGVDMEAYAVMAASDFARRNKPKSLVIKSVSDYADLRKNNLWQEYASYTSVSFFDSLISNDYFQI